MTKLEIVNSALLTLGESPLASLTDATGGYSSTLTAVEKKYDEVVGSLLEGHDWTFCRDILPLTYNKEVVINNQYMYRFTMNNSVIRIIRVLDSNGGSCDYFRLNKDEIVTPTRDAKNVLCLVRTSEDKWPVSFCRAVAAKLTYEIAPAVAGELGKRQASMFFQLAQNALFEAKTADADNIADNDPLMGNIYNRWGAQ